MKLKITITMDNAAFEDNQGGESARILRQLADRIDGLLFDYPGDEFRLQDVNGNYVGEAKVSQ